MALVNGDWTSFDPHTVRMMIRLVHTLILWLYSAQPSLSMFDLDRSGGISFDEFWYVGPGA